MGVFVGVHANLSVHALFLFPTCDSDAVLLFRVWNSFCPQGPDSRNVEKTTLHPDFVLFQLAEALLSVSNEAEEAWLPWACFLLGGSASSRLDATRSTVLPQDSRQEAALSLSPNTAGSQHPVPTPH